jgi:hypothetical protein
MNIRPELEAVLDAVRRDTRCRGIAVARADGLAIVHRGSAALDPRVVAAVAATMMGTAEVAAKQLGQGEIEEITIRCTEGRIIAVNAGQEAIVIALYGREENLGLAVLTLNRAAATIAELLGRA